MPGNSQHRHQHISQGWKGRTNPDKNADMAMYFAKEEGKNNYQFYSKDIQSQSLERLSLETNLRLALERKELSLQYQARLDFKTGAITSVEALLRWITHPLVQ